MQRKALRYLSKAVVRYRYRDENERFPLVMKPAIDGVNLAGWAAANREELETQLLQHGALLFRKFQRRRRVTVRAIRHSLPPTCSITTSAQRRAPKSVKIFTPRLSTLPINISRCIMRCPTRITGRLKSGSTATNLRSRAARLQSPTTEKFSG